MATAPAKSDAEHVREFTIGAGQPSPSHPTVMSREEVEFLGKMVVDELLELYATVMGPDEARSTMRRHLDDAKVIPQEAYEGSGSAEQIADQADALVDVYYYSLNAAAKKGVNLSSLFGVVHAANMAKRDPASGQFLKREDGKILKPAGWAPPDVAGEVRRQMKEGAWATQAPEVRE